MDKDRGHVWITVDGKKGSEVDILAYEVDNHNGPRCINCGYSYCHHCEDGPQEGCTENELLYPDGRHDITNKVLKKMTPVMESQDDFGMDKYEQPLKSSYRYNWLSMAREELADTLKYFECEEERKETIADLIRQAIDADDVFSKNVFLMEALDLLTIAGTGK